MIYIHTDWHANKEDEGPFFMHKRSRCHYKSRSCRQDPAVLLNEDAAIQLAFYVTVMIVLYLFSDK